MNFVSAAVQRERIGSPGRRFNENFPLPVVERLRQLGHEITTVQETGKGSQQMPDDVVLHMATADGRAVLTLNRKHFIHLHKASPQHAGIIACTFDGDFKALAYRVHAGIESQSNLSGKLIRVDRPPT